MSWYELLKGGFRVPKLEDVISKPKHRLKTDTESSIEYPKHLNDDEVI